MNQKTVKDYLNKDISDFELKEKYLLYLKNIIPFDGWSEKVLEEASLSLNFDKNYYRLLFPQRLENIIEFYEDYRDASMLLQLNNIDKSLSITRRVEQALYIRILDSAFSKLFVRKTAEYYTHPQHAVQALKAA